jgi:hypothetical protein
MRRVYLNIFKRILSELSFYLHAECFPKDLSKVLFSVAESPQKNISRTLSMRKK